MAPRLELEPELELELEPEQAFLTPVLARRLAGAREGR